MNAEMGNEQHLKRLGLRLKEIREENNLTIRELASRIGLSGSTLSRYENGKMEPKRTTIKIIAKTLEINPLWLVGYENAEKYYDCEQQECEEPIRVPVVGTIAAGLPILAEENISGYEFAANSIKADFGLIVKGDSMINARILDGDLVFIRSQPTVENGEIAAVVIDGEATLKRVYKANGTLILRAENPNYNDLIYSGRDKKDIRIIGKAVHFRSEVR